MSAAPASTITAPPRAGWKTWGVVDRKPRWRGRGGIIDHDLAAAHAGFTPADWRHPVAEQADGREVLHASKALWRLQAVKRVVREHERTSAVGAGEHRLRSTASLAVPRAPCVEHRWSLALPPPSARPASRGRARAVCGPEL